MTQPRPKVGDVWLSANGNTFRLREKLDDWGNFWWRVETVATGKIGASMLVWRDGVIEGWTRIHSCAD